MVFNLRKLFVWLISLGVAALATYLLVNQPQIDIDKAAEFISQVADANVAPSDSEIGKIGDIGIGTVQKARYTHLNEAKQIDREFGFDKLLHEVGDEWEIEKPYMNIFRRTLKCFITANRGKVRVETAVGGASPKDITLTGNVVIHILPEDLSDLQESFIYLDDITFISDKSQYSTAGPVKFVSENAQMLGTGLELIYNDGLDRLELLRIIDLQSLRLKIPKAGLFSSKKTEVDSAAGTGSQLETQQPAEPAPTDATKKPLQPTGPVVAQQKKGQYYKCLFSKNVVIDSPEQLIFADEFCVNNIFHSETSTGKPGKVEPDAEPRKKSLQEVAEKTAASKQTNADTTINNADTTINDAAKPSEPNESSKQLVDVVVTCSNGIVVTPMGTVEASEKSTKFAPAADASDDKTFKSIDDTTGRTVFVAKRIDYDASTGDTIAPGPSELTFYATDIMDTPGKETLAPVKITTQKKAKFLPELNQVIFEGNCLCKMLREDVDRQRKYTLSAPKLTVTLSTNKDKQSSASATDIEHLTATGGVVKLATIKTAGEKLLGGIELKCAEFNYDTAQQLFSATGPGLIKVDNSKISQPSTNLGRFSLRRKCYAVLRNFETLDYYLQANKIIADAGWREILIDYFPITDGQYGQQVSATASHMEALLYETTDGRNELSTLTATGGISYKEEDIEFEGSKLFYDADSSVITADGDELQPCYLNGALVDSLEYDLKTGRVTAKISGPGTLHR